MKKILSLLLIAAAFCAQAQPTPFPVVMGSTGFPVSVQNIQSKGLNVIFTSPNVTDSHQGVVFDNNGYCYGIASGVIKKRPLNNTGWNFTVQNLTPFTGVPGSLNHFGDGEMQPFTGRLVLPAERIINTEDGCLDTINHNTTIIEYNPTTLALIRYIPLDSTTEISGICFTPDGHMWAINFCDDNYLYEYDSAYHFIAKHLHTGVIADKQGLAYRADINSFYVASNLGKLWAVNKTTGQNLLVCTFQKNELDAFEGLDYNDGCIKWTRHDQIGTDEVMFISDTKKYQDYLYLQQSVVGIHQGTFNIISNSINGLDTPALYIQSNGSAAISLNSPGGSRCSINYGVGGKNNWFMGAMPNTGTYNGDFDIFNYASDGIAFVQPAAFSAKKATNSITIPTLASTTITSGSFKLSALNTAPASATATGSTGDIRVTAGYIYVCTATNTWVRAALATWP